MRKKEGQQEMTPRKILAIVLIGIFLVQPLTIHAVVVSSCGNGEKVIKPSNDGRGTIKTGPNAGIKLPCTVNFEYAWGKAPDCYLRNANRPFIFYVKKTTRTYFEIDKSDFDSGDIIEYMCVQYGLDD